MKILVTGGAGFVGSHVAEYYAKKGDEVVIFDNLSRSILLGYDALNTVYNWDYLKKYNNIDRIKGDIRDIGTIETASKDADVIIHAAAQTAVTTSVKDPRTDFEINALGTFNVLEAARKSKSNTSVIFCSTNKVYGDNVNKIPVKEQDKRYVFNDPNYKKGIPEMFSTDLCEHTPYGTSKFVGDIYVQDYSHVYGLKTAIFRMSCIYGERQFGVEDQGWVAWFVIATLTNNPITIYGDGKQVRDVLYIQDLIKAYDLFMKGNLKQEVFNIGGGSENTLSLLELLDLLEELTGMRAKISYANWRPSDQKVYISDIGKIKEKLKWKPEVNPRDGVNKLVGWVIDNKSLFSMRR